MAGITATISIEQFAAAWSDNAPIADLCMRFSVTKDQVIRLRDCWDLPKRHDRRLRFKPPKNQRDPSPSDIAAACLRIQATWDDRTREARTVQKRQQLDITEIRISDVTCNVRMERDE